MKDFPLTGLRVLLALILTILLTSPTPTLAQTNSWIGSGSGDWESPEWSLGLPSAGQDIFITNAGTKTIVIEPGTAQNYPQTLNIESLTINSSNELLMDAAGLETPLVIGLTNDGELNLRDGNATFEMHGSALTVNGAINVNGTFNQSDGSQVVANNLGGIGIFNLQSGTLQVSGTENVGKFVQFDGTNIMNNLELGDTEYDMSNGYLSGEIILNYGQFIQTGGQFFGNVAFPSIGPCTMIFAGGVLTQSNLDVEGMQGGPYVDYATGVMFTQTGGIIYAENLDVGMIGYGEFTQSGGLLVTTNVRVGPPEEYLWQNTPGAPTFYIQSGGIHSNATITLTGAVLSAPVSGLESQARITGINPLSGALYGVSTYTFTGGLLYSLAINLTNAGFNQSGATTNQVGTISGDSYALSGGLLVAQTIQNGNFGQSGGTIQVDVISNENCTLSGGSLTAQNITLLTGNLFSHAGGTCDFSGSFTLDGGIWQEGTTGQTFCPLQLGPGTNSTIQFPTNICTLNFADSSSLNWSNTGVLTIVNWNGFLSGGGSNQIIFGTNIDGLTQQQLSQIQFANPAGLPAGNYLAKILAHGEIVPGNPSYLDTAPAPFFTGQASIGNQWFYLAGSNHVFGYFSLQYFPYVYHADMGWEYFIDANNAQHGAYFYDFADNAFFYTEPGVFPYLYDFKASAWFYYSSGSQTGHYSSDPRWFYNFSTQSWGNDL